MGDVGENGDEPDAGGLRARSNELRSERRLSRFLITDDGRECEPAQERRLSEGGDRGLEGPSRELSGKGPCSRMGVEMRD